MTDPYFDIGDFVMEHPFSREEQRLIIATYCGEMNERFFARMMLYRMVSGIWWAIWAMIQHTVSQIDFDYMAWGLDRGVRRAHEVLDDPDYSKWLAEA
jgi:thiamine kinase-like enzyme